MASRSRWLWCLILLLAAGSLQARSFPQSPDLLLSEQQRWGLAMQGYVVEGCLPVLTSGLTVQIASCRAFVHRPDDNPARLVGFEEETPRLLTVSGADGPVWVAGRDSPATSAPGWTCLPGVHYCWSASAQPPALAAGLLWLARLTVSGGAVTLVEPLMGQSPLDMQRLDGTLYATQFGLRCDGVTDNSAALEAAIAAAGTQGARLVLPATGPTACLFSRSLLVTTNLWLQGQGSAVGTAGGGAITLLTYTGSGVALTVSGGAAAGSILEGFELRNGGTGTIGISVDGPAFTKLRDVSLSFGTPWTQYGIALGLTQLTHSTILERVVVRDSAPIGLLVGYTQAYTRIVLGRFVGNSVTQIQIGGANTAISTHVLLTDFSAKGDTSGIVVQNAQGVFIDHSYAEVASNAIGLHIPDTASGAEAVTLSFSRMNLLGGTAPTGVKVNYTAAAVHVLHNLFMRGGVADPAATAIWNATSRTLRVIGNQIPNPPFVKLTDYKNAEVYDNYSTAAPGFSDSPTPRLLCSLGVYGGTLGAGEDTLHTCTVPANLWWRQGTSGVRITAGGNTAANGNPKRYRLYLGGQLVFDTQAVVANNMDWQVTCTGVRSDTGSGMFLGCRGQWAGSEVQVQVTPGITLGFGTAITLSSTGESSGAPVDGDIAERFFVVEVWP
jgi:hypothetical protein